MINLLEDALSLSANDCSVIPVQADGSKRPAISWRPYTKRRANDEEIRSWFTDSKYGLGIVTGQVSGNLILIEIEGAHAGLLPELIDTAQASGLGELWQTISTGWVEKSPSGGMHWLIRTEHPPAGNQKLAKDADGTVIAETRGENGFVVAAPTSGAAHATGQPWTRIIGGPTTVPTLNETATTALLELFRSLNQHTPTVIDAPRPERPHNPATDGLRPGDDYNARADWGDILTGWTAVKSFPGGGIGWRRPGKQDPGISATTGRNQADNLYVFTTSTEFEQEVAYSKFAAHTLLHHGGDYAAAARELSRQGYGSQREVLTTRPVGSTTQQLISGTSPTPSDDGAADKATDPSVEREETVLDVTNQSVMADWLRENIGTGKLSGMFLRGHEIVHTPLIGEHGYRPLTRGGNDGPAQLRPLNHSTLASRVQYAYTCEKTVKKDGEWTTTPALFPKESARVAVDAPDQLTRIRPLDGVIHAPIIKTQGHVLTTPGYDEDTRLLYLPDDLHLPERPPSPSGSDVAAAVQLLDQMTEGFPFVTPHDKVNFYGLLLTPILRVLTPAPYKMFAITAPQPGSGKTLLATIARIIHGGIFRSEFPQDDAELRKQITSILTVTTGQIIHIDNLAGTLRSSTLAGLLTSGTWGDRPLGSTEWVGVPNDRVWVVTGNNISLGGDLARRTVWITIDPRMPNPETRTGFTIPDIEAWVTQKRGDIIAALLTLAQAWHQAGRPSSPARGSDGYTAWSSALDGILAHAGIEGRFGHDESQGQVLGAEDEDWGEFLSVVHREFGGREWRVKDVLAKVNSFHAELGEQEDKPIELSSLPDQVGEKFMRAAGSHQATRALGMYLRTNEGRWAGGMTVRSTGLDRSKTRLWRIESVNSSWGHDALPLQESEEILSEPESEM